jgi:hypothetical protein
MTTRTTHGWSWSTFTPIASNVDSKSTPIMGLSWGLIPNPEVGLYTLPGWANRFFFKAHVKAGQTARDFGGAKGGP